MGQECPTITPNTTTDAAILRYAEPRGFDAAYGDESGYLTVEEHDHHAEIVAMLGDTHAPDYFIVALCRISQQPTQ